MNISLNWLKDYVKLHKKITPEEIGKALSLHTVEVERIVEEGERFNNVVVGKILEVAKHPKADRLQLAKVDVGGGTILDIVCGAPNIAPGQLVPTALVGAILPNGMEIKEAEVRGEKSSGMLCAPDELGLGSDHSGILILDKKLKPGEKFSKYLKLDDIVFEIDNKSLSNRPDLWGHYGLARELSAIFNAKLVPLSEIIKTSVADLVPASEEIGLKVRVESRELCPRYMALAMSGVKVGESPDWMKKRLSAAGMRPINNIVDITNYVMLELGQPMHAFDASLVRNKDNAHRIVVRQAKPQETIETLDGDKRELDADMLVIANEERALAIAGVMGGANSEINSSTSTIIFESANFNPVSVRKTSGKLSLRTESSVRYEKSLDPNLCEQALLRAVALVMESNAGAKISSALTDISGFVTDTGPIELDANWLNRKIGNKIPSREVVKILNNLGFSAEHIGHKFIVNIPTWRATKDISIQEDIVEEVIRIYGYEKLSPSLPLVEMKEPAKNGERALERKIKDILSGAPALAEVYNYSFVGEDQLKKLNIDPSSHIRLVNPIASHQTMLRQSLAPNLINAVRTNQARYENFGLFEIGSVFMPAPGNINKDAEKTEVLPYQEKHVGIILASDSDVFPKAKGTVEHLLSSLRLPVSFFEMEIRPVWSDGMACARIISGNVELGTVVKLDEQLGRKQGLKKQVVVAEIGLNALLALASAAGDAYAPLERYPKAARDIAFVVDAKILYNDIMKAIAGSSPLVKEAELFDVYEGDKIGPGNKSLAFHITYQADRTLTSEEVDRLQKDLQNILEEKFEAKLRDF